MVIQYGYVGKVRTGGDSISLDVWKSIGVGFICLFFLLQAACGGEADPYADKWVDVVITEELKEHLRELPEDEKFEQMRDWVVLSFIKHLELDESTTFEALYDFTPLRKDFLKSLSSYKYGESRSVSLKTGDFYVFVPHGSKKKNVYIARLSDEYRMIHGKMPKQAIVVEYRQDIGDSPSARFVQTRSIHKSVLFSGKMGYIQDTVSDKHQLKAFVDSIDDIVYVQDLSDGAVLLGGRKFENHSTMGVGMEDLAAIYQADRKTEELLLKCREDPSVLQYVYDLFILKEILVRARDPKRKTIKTKEEIDEEIRREYPLEKFRDEKLEEFLDTHVGFSLDHQLKYESFARQLAQIAIGNEDAFNEWYDNYEKEYQVKDAVLAWETETENNWRRITLANNGEESLETLMYGKDISCVEEELKKNKQTIGLLSRDDGAVLGDWAQKAARDVYIKAIKNNRDILIEIAQYAENNDLQPYWELRRYLERERQIILRPGQSIDSLLDRKILSDVLYFLGENGYSFGKRKTAFDREVTGAVKSFQKSRGLKASGVVDSETYLELMTNLSDSSRIEEFQYLFDFLFGFKEFNSYQKARYDGDLQGTEVGMTLFYTDLIMKLWGSDHRRTSPQDHIPGFIAAVNYPMDYCYYEEETKNSSTRYWLGPVDAGYEFHGAKSQLFFAHTVAKVYCKSSNDLFPDVEIDPVPSKARFTDWWNSHYSEVADYEPQYHRLNQIIKWSVIFKWLKHNQRFDFLNEESVGCDLNFTAWYTSNEELKVREPMPFLDSGALGETTECLDLLKSRPFIRFAEPERDMFQSSYSIGGVTLGDKVSLFNKIKSTPIRDLIKTGRARAGINYSSKTKLREFATRDGKVFKLNPGQKTANIKNTTAHFRGKSVDYSDLTINRQITNAGNTLKISDKAAPFRVNTLSAVKNGNKVKLSAMKTDFNKAQKLLTEVKKNPASTGNVLSTSSDVNIVVKANQYKYYARLKDSNNWIEVSATGGKIPQNYHLTVSNGQYYQNIKFMEGEAMHSGLGNHAWYKTDTSSTRTVFECTNTAPKNVQQTITASTDAGYSAQVGLTKDSFYLRNYKLKTADNLNTLETLGNHSPKTLDAVRNKFLAEKNVNAFIYNNKGNILRLSNQPTVSSANLRVFKELVRNNRGQIKGVIFSEKGTIRMLGDDILQVPAKMSQQQMRIAKFVTSKTNQNRAWLKTFRRAENITGKDMRILKTLDKRNLKLGESYYHFKSANNLPDNYALVDFNTSAARPQLLIRTQKGGMQIVDAGKPMSTNVRETGSNLTKMFKSKKPVNYNEFVSETRSIADLQKEAIKATKADVIVTKGPAGIDPALISKVHNLSKSTRFVRDQRDAAKSVESVKIGIISDFGKTAFLTPVRLKDDNYKEIGSAYDDILATGISNISNLSKLDFYLHLWDRSKTQLILVIRATKDGLVFSDGFVSFEEIRWRIRLMQDGKELLYIISNQADQLEQFFIDTGKFNFIVSSNYKIGEPGTFKMSLEDAREFVSEIAPGKPTEKNKTNGDIDGKKPSPNGAGPDVGILAAPAVKGTPAAGQNKPKFKTIEGIIDKIQMKRIKQMRNTPPKKLIDFIRGILKLKAENRIPLKDRWYNHGQFKPYDFKLA